MRNGGLCGGMLKMHDRSYYEVIVQFLMFLNRTPLAFAVTSNVFGVSESFYSAESENIGWGGIF